MEEKIENEIIKIPEKLLVCCKCIAFAKNEKISDIVTSILERELSPLMNLIDSY